MRTRMRLANYEFRVNCFAQGDTITFGTET